MPRRCLALLAATSLGVAALAGVDPGLTWAYPKEGPARPPGMYHVEGSPLPPMSKEQLDALTVPPDWLPNLHPALPFIVGQIRKGGAYACAACHQIEGQGNLSTAGLAGLPAGYILEQIREFRDGRRVSSDPKRHETEGMIAEAKRLTEADAAEAAAYFAAVRPQPWVEVVEVATVPRTLVGRLDWLYVDPKGGSEPIDGRIIELARDLVGMMNGDPRVVTIDYVPLGSVAQGAILARRPNASGQTCATCHGDAMQGTPLAPPLAGRYASYFARMLWDIKSGARQGPTVALMQPVVAPLTPAEITALSAYLASLSPPSGPPPAFLGLPVAPAPPAGRG
jgi:cytochrome c553